MLTEIIEHIISNSSSIVFLISEEFIFEKVWTNKEDELFFDEEKFIGKSIMQAFQGKEGERYKQVLSKTLKTNKTQFLIYENPFLEEKKYYQAKIQPLQLKNETKLIVYITNITVKETQAKLLIEQNKSIISQNEKLERINKELKRAKEKAVENYIYYQTIFENTPIGIVHFDKNGILTNCNDYFTEFMGMQMHSLIGVNLLEIKMKALSKCVKVTLTRGETQSKGKYLEAKNGKPKYFKIKGKSIISKRGEILGGVCAISDITALINYEEDLKLAKLAAEESDRLKSAFLANMSHEIRTPMNAILGFAQILDERMDSNNKLRRYTKIIKTSGNYLLALINDILDLSKIEANQLDVSKKEVEVSVILRKIHEMAKAYALEKKKSNLELILDIPQKFVIYTDGFRLEQILMNLVSNAIKFTDTGYVKIGYTLKPKDIEFYIKDTGIGLNPEEQKQVFNRFTQIYDENKLTTGTGLGLALSNSLSKLLQGEIIVFSEKNIGSTFSLRLPRVSNQLSK